jgi:hypothetical protein
VYRLAGSGHEVLLKEYFREPRDHRDRLKHEFSFLEYLWSRGVRCVPRPIFSDHSRDLGVYEFVHGRKLNLEEVGSVHVNQAARFYREINRDRAAPEARRLPPATEACFSMAEHLQIVAHRVERLTAIVQQDEIARSAHRFASCELTTLWNEVRSRVASAWDRKGTLKAELGLAQCCLSPSDFGFHNALLEEESGTVRFLDFEYAGWDDPAKLVCDFANQPDMLLPETLTRDFERQVVEDASAPLQLEHRVRWLRPVYQIKWSCIILNDFLPHGFARARFTGVAGEESARKTEQLDKARSMLGLAETSFATACKW